MTGRKRPTKRRPVKRAVRATKAPPAKKKPAAKVGTTVTTTCTTKVSSQVTIPTGVENLELNVSWRNKNRVFVEAEFEKSAASGLAKALRSIADTIEASVQ